MTLDEDLCVDVMKQQLYMEMMLIGGVKFLLAIVVPLQLTLQPKIETEGHQATGIASRAFIDSIAYMNPQNMLRTRVWKYKLAMPERKRGQNKTSSFWAKKLQMFVGMMKSLTKAEMASLTDMFYSE
jgi:hypothetical protein